jgi:hypothetical protein
LSDFRGKNANGTWKLHITDDNVNGITGNYVCGTINIQSATCSPGGGACELCPQVVITSATGQESQTQINFVSIGGGASVCGISKPCPGTTLSGPLPVDTHMFWSGLSNTCVTVTLTNQAPGSAMISVAYWGIFDPGNLDKCVNFLADSGTSVGGGGILSYSFNVPANTNFTVTVVCDTTARSPYTLALTGGDCRPVLDVAAASVTQARLNWTTATPGFNLERTNNLTGGGGGWEAISTVPVVVDSKFTVTNNVSGTNQFYRLIKP